MSIFRRMLPFPSHWHSRKKRQELTEDDLRIIRDRLETLEDSLQEETEPLLPVDYQLMGQFVQAYCIADFYARRILEDERFLRDERKPFAGNLNDFDALTHLRMVGKELPINDVLRDDLEKISKTLLMHRSIRHLFSHWAARRVSGHDILIFYTNNSSENKKHTEVALDLGSSRFAIIETQKLQTELNKLKINTQSLVGITTLFERNFPEINLRRFEQRSKE